MVQFFALIAGKMNVEANDQLKKNNIKVKIKTVSAQQIKFKIINRDVKRTYISGEFVLKRRVNGKWSKVKLSPECLGFAKTITIPKKSSINRTFKWSDYFDLELSKGKYLFKLYGFDGYKFELK